MGRVHSLRTATAATTQSRLAGRQNANGKKKPSYKIIIEQVTEKKKKLLTTIANQPYQDTLGQQINRVGYHFPSIVLEQACTNLGISLTLNGRMVGNLDSYYEHRIHSKKESKRKRGNNKEQSWFVEPNEKQEDIDARACVAIKDLFPKIPDKDIKRIINRVGTAADQPFLRRVHLAVGAHIRHVYTDYDKLLKNHSFMRARALVQQASIDKMVEWRDDDKDSNEVEDILREVIVISDDEEDEESADTESQREDSREIISNHVFANDLQTRPVDYSAIGDSDTYHRPFSPDDSRASRTAYVRPVRNPYDGSNDNQLLERQQAYRFRIWDDAVIRRRNAENSLHPMAEQLQPYPMSSEVQPVVHMEQYQRPRLVESRHSFYPILNNDTRRNASFHQDKALVLDDVSSFRCFSPRNKSFVHINELFKSEHSSRLQQRVHDLPHSFSQGHERPRRSWPFSIPQEHPLRYSDPHGSSHVPANEIQGQDYLEPSNPVSERILPSIERDPEGAGRSIQPYVKTGQLSPRGPRIIELDDDYSETINALNENDSKRRKTNPPPSPPSREYIQHDGQGLLVPTNYPGWTTPLDRGPATMYPMSSHDPQYRSNRQPMDGPRPTRLRQPHFRETDSFVSPVNSQPMPPQGRPNQVVYLERRPEDVTPALASSWQWEEAHVQLPQSGYRPSKSDPSNGVSVDPYIHRQPVPRPYHEEIPLNTRMKHEAQSKRENVKPQPVSHKIEYLQPAQDVKYTARSSSQWESRESHDARPTFFSPQESQRSSGHQFSRRESFMRDGTYALSFHNQMRIDGQGPYVIEEPKPRLPAPREMVTTMKQPIFISSSPPLEEWFVVIVELIIRLANELKGPKRPAA
ncbi:MAG: hypothetical protein Q9167_003936 [Letrouitia subvulpina]